MGILKSICPIEYDATINPTNPRLAPKSLEKIGDSLYQNLESEEKELPVKTTKMHQGFLENSNVSTVNEMTEMISTLRIFETYQKIIQSNDSMNDQSVNTIGRVG